MEGISPSSSNTRSLAAATQKIIALKEAFGSSHLLDSMSSYFQVSFSSYVPTYYTSEDTGDNTDGYGHSMFVITVE